MPMTDFPVFVLNRSYMATLANILTFRLQEFFAPESIPAELGEPFQFADTIDEEAES